MEDVCIVLALFPYFVLLCILRTLPALVSFALIALIVLAIQRFEGCLILHDPFHIDLAGRAPPLTPVCSEASSTDSDC